MLTWHSRTLTRSLLSQGRLASTPKDEPQLGHAALSTLNFTDPPLVFSTLPLPPHSLPPSLAQGGFLPHAGALTRRVRRGLAGASRGLASGLKVKKKRPRSRAA